MRATTLSSSRMRARCGYPCRELEHVASVEYLVQMMSSVLRYWRGGGLGDRVSEHVASVEYLI